MTLKSDQVSDCCFMSSEQYFSHIMVRTNNIQWDDNDDVIFGLDKHT